MALDLWNVDFEQPEPVLATWWNIFNRWEFPTELIHLMPEDWSNWNYGTKHDFIRGIMRHLAELVPEKERMRFHHRVNLGRTEEEFEEWWNKNDAPWLRESSA